MGGRFRLSKRYYTGKEDKRIILEGFHPSDSSGTTYAFIASDYLSFYCKNNTIENKVVLVDTKHGYRPLYVINVRMWENGDCVPERIALMIHNSKKYKNYTPY